MKFNWSTLFCYNSNFVHLIAIITINLNWHANSQGLACENCKSNKNFSSRYLTYSWAQNAILMVQFMGNSYNEPPYICHYNNNCKKLDFCKQH